MEAARAAGELVVWVLHAEPGSGGEFDPANGHVRLVDELEPAKDEPLVTKTSHNAFTTTNLRQLLTMAGVNAVAVCGLRTEQCVETTARVASDFGYEVTFVTDATGTFPIPHWDAPADQTRRGVAGRPAYAFRGGCGAPHRIRAGRPIRHGRAARTTICGG